MGQRTLVPDGGEVVLEQVTAQERGRLIIRMRPAREESNCPACGRISHRVHSWYQRRLSDLPWLGIPVRIELRARRFFCDDDDCGQRIFAERLAETAPWYARRTRRQSAALEQIALALGGEAGSRLAEQMGILASDSTLLRQLRRRAFVDCPRSPRVVGIDDWAWRKGHRYGTIFCDLERGKVVDLLPDRSTESTEKWLRAHPGAEIISRDRASLYAEAATKAAPRAVQVADRWHLLHNLSEALVDALRPHHHLLSDVARAVAKDADSTPAPELACGQSPITVRTITREKQMQQQNRERRLARYEAVMEQIRQGVSQQRAARQLGMDRKTVRLWVRAQGFPERRQVERSSILDPFHAHLEMRWYQGCHNGTQLWSELRAQGFAGRLGVVRAWIRERFGDRRRRSRQPPSPATPPRASPRQVAWWLLKQPEGARRYLDQLDQRSPQISQCAALAREFFRIIRKRDYTAWPAWRSATATTPFAHFTKHLCQDEAAFIAALEHPWSNGPVEGHIHRLKLIKRSMYGRAKFDLLRIRVVNAA